MNIIKKRVWQTQYMHIKRQTYLFDAYSSYLTKVGVAGALLVCAVVYGEPERQGCKK